MPESQQQPSEKLAIAAGALRCPTSGQRLSLVTRNQAATAMGFNPVALRTNGTDKAKTIGTTELILLREDNQIAYPVVDGVPILLAPEALGNPELAGPFDLDQPAFAEAYLEMDFYNEVGSTEAANITDSEGWEILDALVRLTGSRTDNFMHPPEAWLDAIYDSAAQADAYEALMPIANRVFAQIGGKGIHAVKFLLAGAAQAWVVTPMLGEAKCAMALAERFGVESQMQCVVSVAEQLPFSDEVFDGVFVGGSVHHMETALAMPEISRTLAPGGAFGAVEPYRAPLYAIGTRILGKREANAHCTPLDEDRIAPFLQAFDGGRVVHHGALSRYPLLALWKFGARVPFGAVWKINKLDDAVSSKLSRLRAAGSSVSLLGRNG